MTRQRRRTFLQTTGAVLGGIAAGTTVTAAERTDRFIVDVRGTTVSRLRAAGLDVVYDLDAVDFAVVEGAESDLESVTSDYAADVEVELDDPDVNDDAPTEDATDEPYYGLQWDKQVQDVPSAHEVTRGEGTRVTIIDTGVAAGHPDLEHAVDVEDSINFTGDGLGVGGPYGGYHGTHVAGIVAAADRNDAGVVGSAPGTEVLDFRVFSADALASFADVVAAMYYSAVHDADAANLSLGAYPVPRQVLEDFYGKVLNRTTTWVNSQGTLLVAAAGNDAADLQHDRNYISLPAENAQVSAVSATGPIGFNWDEASVGDEAEPGHAPAIYTNYGTNAICVGAPGGNYSPAGYDEYYDGDDDEPGWYCDLVLNCYAEVVTKGNGDGNGKTETEHGYRWVAGTSMAAPQVTAAAALVKSVNPDYGANEVEDVLERTASVPEGYDRTYYGAGFLDPNGAVRD